MINNWVVINAYPQKKNGVVNDFKHVFVLGTSYWLFFVHVFSYK